MDVATYVPNSGSNFFTRLADCCKPAEEKGWLLDGQDPPPKCQKLRDIVQHPLPLFLAESAFGACATQLVTRWIMGGPGCNLDSLYEGAALIVSITVGAVSGGVSIIGNLVQRSDEKRLIREASGIDLLEENFVSGSDSESGKEVSKLITDRCAAPCGQFLRNACKNPIVMGGTALIAGIFFDVLLWPTILDVFNCDLSKIQSGSFVMIVSVIALIGSVCLYFIGACFRSSDRDTLVKIIDDTNKLEFRVENMKDVKDGKSTYDFELEEELRKPAALGDRNEDNDFSLHTKSSSAESGSTSESDSSAGGNEGQSSEPEWFS